jgi:hypothetical protein
LNTTQAVGEASHEVVFNILEACTGDSMLRLRSPNLWIITISLLAWLIAELMVPSVIRSAYDGQSLEIFNRLINGQDLHPPERYVDAWRGVERRFFVLAGLVVVFWIGLRPPLANLLKPVFHTEPQISPAMVLATAFTIGVLAGVAEVTHLTIRHLVERHPGRDFSWDLLWIGPVSSAVMFLLIAVLLLVITRILTRGNGIAGPISLRLFVLFFSFLAFYSLLESPRLRLFPAAAIILSLGLAWQVTRVAIARSANFNRLARRGLSATVVLLLGLLVYGFLTLPGQIERRNLTKLPAALVQSPNILLIILDTVRAENLSVYGYPISLDVALACQPLYRPVAA